MLLNFFYQMLKMFKYEGSSQNFEILKYIYNEINKYIKEVITSSTLIVWSTFKLIILWLCCKERARAMRPANFMSFPVKSIEAIC